MIDQGKTYLAFIEAELKAERDRRSSYDARGQALITTSGTLITLLAGLAALARAGNNTPAPTWSLVFVVVSLCLFVSAAACGIVAGWNRSYAVASYPTLIRMLTDRWPDDEVDARNNVATIEAMTADTLRRGNTFKATCVSVGLIAQVLALGSLGVAVVIVLAHL